MVIFFTVTGVTFTEIDPETLLPSVVVPVITASPSAFAIINPVSDTVAISSFEEVHFKLWDDSFGKTV